MQKKWFSGCVMGNQQSVKSEPKPIPNLSTLSAVPSSIRSSRSKPRVPKGQDPRTIGSNIFTEHNGKSTFFVSSLCKSRQDILKKTERRTIFGRRGRKKKKLFVHWDYKGNCYASFYFIFVSMQSQNTIMMRKDLRLRLNLKHTCIFLDYHTFRKKINLFYELVWTIKLHKFIINPLWINSIKFMNFLCFISKLRIAKNCVDFRLSQSIMPLW